MFNTQVHAPSLATPMLALFVLGLMCWATTAAAVNPSVGRFEPAGAQRGTNPIIGIRGGNFSDAVDLTFHDSGITLQGLEVVDNGYIKATLEIAPDCPVGLQGVRVRTKTGISNLMLFSVGSLPELDEAEPNNDMAAPQVVAMNHTINGRVQSEDVDYFAIDFAEAGRLSVEIEALRLGRQLNDPKVRLFSPTGHEVVTADDAPLMRQDSGFSYAVTEPGRYMVAVTEAAYGGNNNFYYRLHVGSFPRPMAVTPMGGQTGTSADVRWIGDSGIESQTVAFVEAPKGVQPFAPSGDIGTAPSPMPLRSIPHPTTLEIEPNNDFGTATVGTAPGAFDGVIDSPGDEDFFKFEGTKGQVYDVRVWARELGSPLDSVLGVLKVDGNQFAGDDDSAKIDSKVRVTLPEDGVHGLRVRDLLGRGGQFYNYRVEVIPVEPKLSFTVSNNQPISLVIPQSNRAYMLLSMGRNDFNSPIDVSLLNLPPGVTAEYDAQLAKNATKLPVLLTAAPDAAPAGSLIEILGKAPEDAGVAVQGGLDQFVTLIRGDNNTTFYPRDVNRIAAVVTEPAPFTLEMVAPTVPIARNGAHRLKLRATRAAGFNAEIKAKFPYVPGGIGIGTAKFAAIAEPKEDGSDRVQETEILIEAKGNAPLGVQKLAVIGTGGGYTVSTPFTPVEFCEPFVNFAFTATETEQGNPVEIAVALTHAREYAGEHNVRLIGLPKGITAEPQPLAHGKEEIRFAVAVAEDATVGKHTSLGINVDINMGEESVLHRAGGGQLTVHKPLPPELAQPKPEPKPEPKADEPQPEPEPERMTRFGPK